MNLKQGDKLLTLLGNEVVVLHVLPEGCVVRYNGPSRRGTPWLVEYQYINQWRLVLPDTILFVNHYAGIPGIDGFAPHISGNAAYNGKGGDQTVSTYKINLTRMTVEKVDE